MGTVGIRANFLNFAALKQILSVIMKRFLFFLVMALLAAGSVDAAKRKVHTIGDSTMQTYDEATSVTRGWGQYFQQFFNPDSVTVNNRGKSGASSKSFYLESAYWQSVKTQISAGDYVIIQFAHNDEKTSGMDGDSVKAYYTSIGDATSAANTDYRGTTPYGTYKEFLRRYVNETRALGATPILAGSICRSYFNGNSIKRNGWHDLGDSFSVLTATGIKTGQKVAESDNTMDYVYQTKQVAEELDVPFIDMTTASAEMYLKYGSDYTQNFIMDGNGSTHTSKLGATLVARMAAQLLKEQGILAESITLESDISVYPATASLGTAYKGQSLTQDFQLSAFDLVPAAGSVSVSCTDGLLLSSDGSTWGKTLALPYTDGNLIGTFYAKLELTETGDYNETITVSSGDKKVEVPVTATALDNEGGTPAEVKWPFNAAFNNATTGTSQSANMFSVMEFTMGSDLHYTQTRTINSDIGTISNVQPSTSNVASNLEEDALVFTLIPKKGVQFHPTHIGFRAAKVGTNGGKFDVVVSNGTQTQVLAENFTPQLVKEAPYVSECQYDVTNVIASGDAFTLKIYIKGLANNKEYGFQNFVISGEVSGTPEEVPQYTLTTGVNIPEAGTVTVSPAGEKFDKGTSITLTASENFGYTFEGWVDKDVEVISEKNPYTFEIKQDTYLQAKYHQNEVFPLNVSVSGGANLYMLSLEPAGTIIDGVHWYEKGTEVKVKASGNKILTFTNWEDNTTGAERDVVVNEAVSITANYACEDFIVAWDFYNDQPATERAADFKDESDNAGLLSLRNAAGSTTSWLACGSSKGAQNGKYGARIWRLLSDKYYFEMSFSTIGYNNIRMSSALGNDYNSYETYYVQWSTDGQSFTTFGEYHMPTRGWTDQTITLPVDVENKSKIWVRFYPNFDSGKVAVESDYDGFTVGETYFFADKDASQDEVPPVLISSIPANDATGVSASGSIVLTFDEKVLAGTGNATLNGESLETAVTGKNAIFKYSGLKYNTNYTFALPAGAVIDRNGNAYEGCEISFTTMERTQPDPRVYDAVVAQDGSGDYTTITEAITAAPANRVKPWLIFVKEGTYTGHHLIPANKPYIYLIGQGKDKVFISDSRLCGGDNAYGIDEGATTCVKSGNCYFEGISFMNSYGYEQKAGPQALALVTDNDRIVFNKCAWYSYQDTYYSGRNANDRVFVKDSWIEGAVDFIYGSNNVYFDRDTINIVRKSGGYIVAPSHPANTEWGYVFMNNLITAPGVPSQTDVWLGRPWHNSPKTVYINTKAEVTIPATGWYPTMGGLPAIWADYNTMDAYGNPVDLSNRREWYYYMNGNDTVWGQAKNHLTDEEAAQYTVKNCMSGTDSWQPELLCEACSAPEPIYAEGDENFTWEPVPYAICYVVTKDGKVDGFTTNCSYSYASGAEYAVQAVNEYGGLSQAGSLSMAPSGIDEITQNSHNIQNSRLYNTSGVRVDKNYRGIKISNGRKTLTVNP